MHKQLTYMLRLMQHRQMMDGDLGAIASNSLKPEDLLLDYELTEDAAREDGIKRLDVLYFAYVRWLEASLRSLGCDEETVAKEASKYRLTLENAVKQRRAELARSK
jgi:hypothetical protein